MQPQKREWAGRSFVPDVPVPEGPGEEPSSRRIALLERGSTPKVRMSGRVVSLTLGLGGPLPIPRSWGGAPIVFTKDGGGSGREGPFPGRDVSAKRSLRRPRLPERVAPRPDREFFADSPVEGPFSFRKQAGSIERRVGSPIELCDAVGSQRSMRRGEPSGGYWQEPGEAEIDLSVPEGGDMKLGIGTGGGRSGDPVRRRTGGKRNNKREKGWGRDIGDAG